jgi:hypothetical protein
LYSGAIHEVPTAGGGNHRTGLGRRGSGRRNAGVRAGDQGSPLPTLPADTKFKLRVTNEDATPEEFESTDFNRETVVLGKRSIIVYVGPLHAGTYGFFGDFHRDTAQGRLIVE